MSHAFVDFVIGEMNSDSLAQLSYYLLANIKYWKPYSSFFLLYDLYQQKKYVNHVEISNFYMLNVQNVTINPQRGYGLNLLAELDSSN